MLSFYSISDLTSWHLWWYWSVPRDIADEADRRVDAQFPFAGELEEALENPAAHESLVLMWIAAVEAVCVERGTTLEKVGDIF